MLREGVEEPVYRLSAPPPLPSLALGQVDSSNEDEDHQQVTHHHADENGVDHEGNPFLGQEGECSAPPLRRSEAPGMLELPLDPTSCDSYAFLSDSCGWDRVNVAALARTIYCITQHLRKAYNFRIVGFLLSDCYLPA